MTNAETRTAAQHTPEPWECPGTDGGAHVICHTDSSGKRRTLAHVYSKADASRIVACVNLLAEFTNEQLADPAVVAKIQAARS